MLDESKLDDSAQHYVKNFLRKSQIGPSGIGLKQVEMENLYPKNNANLKQRPISPGIFKGYYEPHGIELIALHYPDKSILKAVKLTGDHNVPMDKVTFTADLKKGKKYTEQSVFVIYIKSYLWNEEKSINFVYLKTVS